MSAKRRVQLENEELELKGEALGEFIDSDEFKELAPEMQSLMNLQLKTMAIYSCVLEQRLEIW